MRCFSAALSVSQVSLILAGSVSCDVAEDVRVAPDHLLHQAPGDVLDVELARLGGDRGMQVDLQQHVAELLAQMVGVAGASIASRVS